MTFTKRVTGLGLDGPRRSRSSAARRDRGRRARSRSGDGAAFDDELAFALELAGRAGAVLMDRYERLERIDYKSARDVVTEADHLSEALIVDAIRARYPGGRASWPRRPASTGRSPARRRPRAAAGSGSSTRSTGP